MRPPRLVDCALTEELAELLGIGIDLSVVADKAPIVAYVHEQLCIGCTKCFTRCPTDAILGEPKMIHFEVCPTEGIEMCLIGATFQTWYWPRLALAG